MAVRVALLSTSDIGHGAGVAAFRLHRSLKKAGVASSMLVSEKLSDDPDVFRLKESPRGWFGRLTRRALHNVEKGLNLLGPQNVFSIMAAGIRHHPLVVNADIIHLHNIHWASRNLSLLLLNLDKPVVWTFHDTWALTGHCFYPFGCMRWQTGCGKCPDLDIFPRLVWDTTALQWRIKKYLYDSNRPAIVAPSRWMEDMARRSPLFEHCRIQRIPYGIDTNEFPALSKIEARKVLGLTHDGNYLVWTASDLDDPRKGYSAFEKTLLLMKDRPVARELVILLVGKDATKQRPLEQYFRVIRYGHVSDIARLSKILSAADIFVSTSLQDNLPNSILESLACATPVAGFATGGIPDMVKHNESGYLTNVNDCNGLADGIDAMLRDPAQLERMSRACRQTIDDEFSYTLQASRHVQLYRQAIEARIAR